ncbi:hypothetical protein NA78x_004931 [Anatilimnocola sp. NA78]|uniref:hypothetical protein n=1 Tax=Anatilimnocola sp. NA78 TaxID=3415683 RepID=UPI003CE51833
MNQNRYRWVKPSDLPDRVELIDNLTTLRVAVITDVNRRWCWKRNTTLLLHGVPPAEGIEASLTQAKIKVLEGLPD